MKPLGTFIAILALSSGAVLEAQGPPGPKVVMTSKPSARTFVWKGMGRGYLGVEVVGLTPELRAHFGAPQDRGVMVARVEEDSPAGRAGVRVGDILTEVEGEPITGPRSLTFAIRAKKTGDQVALEYLRDGGSGSVLVAIEERDRPMIDLAGMEALPDFTFPAMPHPGVFVAGPDGPLDEEAVKAFEEAMKDLEGRFQTEEWQNKLKRIQELDLSKIQDRMKEVEERLRSLEAELEKEGKKKLD